jgi:non-canonical (house-cleaning) NTP pyrophosphatase
MKILVTSKNIIKHSAIYDIIGFNTILDSVLINCNNPAQPYGKINNINSALICAENLTNSTLNDKYDLIISIENGIIKEDEIYYDICEVDIYDMKNNIRYNSQLFEQYIKVPINPKFIRQLKNNANKTDLGYSMSIGSLVTAELFKIDNTIIDSNWTAYFGVDRHKQIKKTLEWCYNNYLKS